jgi:SH3-like domain-containing protein
MRPRLLLALLLAFAPPAAFSAEFLSIGENATPMYDAPSAKANKLYVASKFFPVEVVVRIDAWIKVRDAAGDLSWVEKRSLSEARTVVVTAQLAEVRQKAEDGAPLAFQARLGVALEVAELTAGPWVKVRHRDGQTGFVRISQVWGL